MINNWIKVYRENGMEGLSKLITSIYIESAKIRL